MAIPTVQIQGKVLTPDGDPVASGRIEVSLSQAGSALDGASSVRLAPGASAPGSLITLGTGGVLPASAVLVPNDAITPSGTYYRARFVVTPADSALRVEWTEKWQLASTPNPLDIGAVPRIEGTPAAAYSVTAAVAQQIVAAAQADADAAASSAAAAQAAAAAIPAFPAPENGKVIGWVGGALGNVVGGAGSGIAVHPTDYVAAEDEVWIPQVITPTFNPPAGSFEGTQAVAITSATPDATVYYTADGSTPTSASTPYAAPVSVAASSTLKARAYKAGVVPSPVASAAYVISAAPPDTTAPVVTAFTMPATSDSLTVAISSFTATDAVGVTGYKITESAVPPLAGDAGWVTPAPTSIVAAGEGARTFYAWAKDAAGNVSAALSAACTITLPLAQVATPTFNPVAGTYTGTQTVAISTTTADATIHYTTDGTDPTTGSPTYAAPIEVAANATLKALAVKAGMEDSEIASAAYVIEAPVSVWTDQFNDSSLHARWTAYTQDGGQVVENTRLQLNGKPSLSHAYVYTAAAEQFAPDAVRIFEVDFKYVNTLGGGTVGHNWAMVARLTQGNATNTKMAIKGYGGATTTPGVGVVAANALNTYLASSADMTFADVITARFETGAGDWRLVAKKGATILFDCTIPRASLALHATNSCFLMMGIAPTANTEIEVTRAERIS